MKKIKVKGVFAGGSTRYPCYVGFISGIETIFEDKGFKFCFEEVIGTSAGAIIAAGTSAGMRSKELEKLCYQVLPRNLLDRRLFPFGGKRSYYKGEKILNALREYLPANFSDTVIPCNIVTHNWTRGRNEVHKSGDLPLAVRASMSLPIFDMVKIGKELHEDGGYSGNFKVDFRNWQIQNNSLVFGFRFGSSRGIYRKEPFTKLDRFNVLLNDMIEAQAHNHTPETDKLTVFNLTTTEPSLNLKMGEKEVGKMILEGFKQALAWAEYHPQFIDWLCEQAE